VLDEGRSGIVDEPVLCSHTQRACGSEMAREHILSPLNCSNTDRDGLAVNYALPYIPSSLLGRKQPMSSPVVDFSEKLWINTDPELLSFGPEAFGR